MKNKILFIFNSIKQSIVNKPIAFSLLILIFFAMTCCCSLPSRFAASDIRDAYSREARLSFSMKADKFKQNKTAFFESLERIENELNATDSMRWTVTISQFNCDIKVNGTSAKLDSIGVSFTKFKPEEIEGKGNVCEIGDSYAKELGIEKGDIFNIFGIDFEVINISMVGYGFWIPYNTNVENWYSSSYVYDMFTGKTKESKVTGGVGGLSRADTDKVYWKLIKFGCKRDNTATIPLAGSFIVVLAMLIIGMVASTTILIYWLKCNNKKYATYKTLGCSPTMLAVTMTIETMLMAVLAIGLGVLFDFVLSIVMTEKIIITGFEWLHYLMLIGTPLVSILIVTIIAVVKRAFAMPAVTKYNF